MNTPSPLSLVFGICLGAIGASAAVSLDGLVAESPFMPKREENTAAPVATENAAVEFRGLISTKEGVLFGLYDRTRNVGAWVKEKDKGSDFNVRSYDAAADMVTIDYQGQKYTLPLSTSRIATAAPSAAPVVARPAGGTPQQAVAKPADATRLESVAAEVRRRRALRQAGAQPTPVATGTRTAPAATKPAATPETAQ